MYWTLNGVRIENQETSANQSIREREPLARQGIIYLTETMLDSTRANVLQLFVHSGDSLFVARRWNITLSGGRPVKWAYQAVRAVILAMEPDGRPGARRPGPDGIDPLLGTFRVLEQSRRLAAEELTYWDWPAEAGGDATVDEAVQASVYNPGMSYLP